MTPHVLDLTVTVTNPLDRLSVRRLTFLTCCPDPVLRCAAHPAWVAIDDRWHALGVAARRLAVPNEATGQFDGVPNGDKKRGGRSPCRPAQNEPTDVLGSGVGPVPEPLDPAAPLRYAAA